MLLSDAKLVLKEFEKQLNGYKIESFIINQNEKVIVIEDALVLYLATINHYEYWLQEKAKTSRNYNPHDVGLYIVELTYNTINFVYKKVPILKFAQNLTNIEFPPINYLKFFRAKEKYTDYSINQPIGKVLIEPDLTLKITKRLPELKLKERQDIWPGILPYFVVLEVIDVSGNIGRGVFCTTTTPYSFINKHCQLWIKKGFYAGNFDAVGGTFERALLSWRGKQLKRKYILENYMQYFYIEKNLRNKDDLWQIKWNILENAKKGFYDNIERNTYIRPSNRWKTEELIYKYIKKIYKNYKVIYQHRPFFLVGPSGGQMSYDIFITGLNIAIEYQGRQHFEPVDFFGGQESFEKTIVRDKLKKELSEKNNIKLIYINYWENVSLSFIKEKIEKILSELELQNPQL